MVRYFIQEPDLRFEVSENHMNEYLNELERHIALSKRPTRKWRVRTESDTKEMLIDRFGLPCFDHQVIKVFEFIDK